MPGTDRRRQKLIDELYDGFGVVSMPMGNTGGQTFGWFRKEIKSPADFQGVKMRVAGFGGRVLAKLGVVPQQIAGGDIYPALEKGTLDAAEWVGPHDDEKLGFHKVAKYMHIPGVLEMEANSSLYVNKATWTALPAAYQSMLRSACSYALMEMLARYDALNAKAITRVVAQWRADRRADPRDAARVAQRTRAGARRGVRQERTVQEGGRQLAHIPGRAAPLVFDRGCAHRDVGLCAHRKRRRSRLLFTSPRFSGERSTRRAPAQACRVRG